MDFTPEGAAKGSNGSLTFVHLGSDEAASGDDVREEESNDDGDSGDSEKKKEDGDDEVVVAKHEHDAGSLIADDEEMDKGKDKDKGDK